MKKFFIFIMLLTSASIYSQDVIVKKDGSTILSKVLEVGEEYVKYKKWSNTQGPDYTIKVIDIISINYENGDKDDFSTTTNTPKTSTINNNVGINTSSAITATNNNTYTKEELDKAINEAAYNAAKKSRAGRGYIIAGGILTFVGLSNLISGVGIMAAIDPANGVGIGCLVGGTIVTTLGGCMIGSGRSERKYYAVNKMIKHEFELGNYTLTPSVDMYTNKDAEFSGLGAGLCLTF